MDKKIKYNHTHSSAHVSLLSKTGRIDKNKYIIVRKNKKVFLLIKIEYI